MRVVLVVALVLLAGCSTVETVDDDAPGRGLIAGWVVDHALRPVPEATVHVEGLGDTMTDQEGRFQILGNLTRDEYVVVAKAPGFLPASTVVAPTHAAQEMEVRIQVQPLVETGYTRLQTFQGLIACEVVAQVGHSHGTGNPDEDDRFGCSPGVEETRNFTIATDRQATDMLIEVVWEPSTPRAEYLTFAMFDGLGDVLVFHEGQSVLRMEIGSLIVEEYFAQGQTATLRAYTGVAEDDPTEVFLGLSIDQEFDIFMTTFHGGMMPRGYSVVD